MFRLRPMPLFAELKDLDLRPHPPLGEAMHHAAQRVKTFVCIAIWWELSKPISDWLIGNQVSSTTLSGL
jgi:hypothetical protein